MGASTVDRSTPTPSTALLTLNNPTKLGALNDSMLRQLAAHWSDIKADGQIRSIVLTGTGRGFSTGLDLEGANTGADPATLYGSDEQLPHFGFSPLEFDVWKPYIVAVNGVCAGGGFHLLADADIIIASTDARFLDPHVSVGQVAALEPIMLTRRMALGAVLRMTVLGRRDLLSAEEARAAGLVSEVHSPDDLLPRALELAAMAAEGSPAAIERSKRSIWKSLQLGLDDALQYGWTQIREHWDHPDFREGIAAYNEQRSPRWVAGVAQPRQP
jgi:enoyl-CoA hydratase/carnithine racemase